jgi:uncharacterized protein RhaS with RHS repeats
LHYNWHRYYDPNTGRYISADPIGIAGGLNLYGYVDGDPVNGVDPQGLQGTLVLPRPFVIPRLIPSPGTLVDPVLMPSDSIEEGIDKAEDAASDQDCPGDPGDPCKGLRQQLEAHVNKLEKYREDPYAYDNKGFLATNPPERHQKIIDGRIRNLEKQIKIFERDYHECLKKHGIPFL